MSFYRIKNPWEPGYALSPNVNDETLGRGTIVTKGLRRKTFNVPKKVGSGGYALPANVRAEPIGRGTITTKWLPRRTVSQKAPDTFADNPRPIIRGSLSGTSLSGTVFERTTLGRSPLGGSGMPDPFRDYGKKAAAWIMVRLAKVPAAQRRAALKALLDAVDPKLFTTVEEKALKYRDDLDASNKESLKLALEASLANGISTEIVELGYGKPGPLMGLGAIGTIGGGGSVVRTDIEVAGARFTVDRDTSTGLMKGTKRYTSLGGFQGLRLPPGIDAAFRKKYNELLGKGAGLPGIGKLGVAAWLAKGNLPVVKFGSPAHGVYVALDTGAINDEIRSATLTIKKIPPPDGGIPGAGFVGSIVTAPFKIVGEVGKVGVKIAGAATDLVKEGLEKLGELGCAVANNPLTGMAAAGAGSVAGGNQGAQAAVVGTGVAQQMCGGGGGGGVAAASPSVLPWVIAGGGALLLVLAVSTS